MKIFFMLVPTVICWMPYLVSAAIPTQPSPAIPMMAAPLYSMIDLPNHDGARETRAMAGPSSNGGHGGHSGVPSGRVGKAWAARGLTLL